MPFEKYTERQRQMDRPARLNIRPGYNQGYLTVGAVEKYFQRGGGVTSRIAYYTDREYSKLGISVAEDGPDSFTVQNKDSGASISVGGTLMKAFDVDVDDLDKQWKLDLTKDDEHGLVVADVSELVEATTGAVHCSECGLRCASDRGLASHVGSIHDSARQDLEDADPDEWGGEAPDGDDSYKDYTMGGESA